MASSALRGWGPCRLGGGFPSRPAAAAQKQRDPLGAFRANPLGLCALRQRSHRVHVFRIFAQPTWLTSVAFLVRAPHFPYPSCADFGEFQRRQQTGPHPLQERDGPQPARRLPGAGGARFHGVEGPPPYSRVAAPFSEALGGPRASGPGRGLCAGRAPIVSTGVMARE